MKRPSDVVLILRPKVDWHPKARPLFSRLLGAFLPLSVLVSTIGIGLGTFSLGSSTFQSAIMAIGFLTWTILIGLSAFRWVKNSIDAKSKLRQYFALIGTVAVLLGLTSLWLAQQIYSNEFLTWNVDYRLHLMHTNSIILTGGLEDLLLMAGQNSEYHAGPAWIVAALYSSSRLGIAFTSFLLVPLVSYLSLLVGTMALGSFLSIRPASVLFGAVFASVTPFLITGGLAWAIVSGDFSPFITLNADVWQFGPGMMLNSQLALGCLGIGIWAISAEKYRSTQILGSLILGSIMLVKPQIALAGIVLLAAIVATRAISSQNFKFGKNGLAQGLIVSLLLGVSLFVARPGSFTGGVIELRFIEPGFSNFAEFGPVALTTLLFCGLFSVYAFRRSADFPGLTTSGSPAFLGLLSGFVLLALLGTVIVRVFLVVDGTVVRDLTSDILQGFWYLTWLALGLFVALCLDILPGNLFSFLAFMYSVAFAVLYLLRVVADLLNPTEGYEHYDSAEVVKVLSAVPASEALLMTTDFAEPADNFRRGGDANYLASSRIPLFLGGLQGPDVAGSAEAQRRAELQRLFLGSAWSLWHEDFLKTEGITHILLSDRCVPEWGSNLPETFREISGSASWTLFEVSDQTQTESIAGAPHPAPTATKEIKPTYGLSGCLGP